MKTTAKRPIERTQNPFPLQFVTLAAGLALAASMAITIGEGERETARFTERPVAAQSGGTGAAPDGRTWVTNSFPTVQYYVVTTEEEALAFQTALDSEAGAAGPEEPSSIVRLLRTLSTPQEEDALQVEFDSLSREGVMYSITDLRLP
jgi:hypothetical protein